MKKTIHINIGQRPFIIDDDAYDALELYLKQIENIFSSSPEISEDIELRIGELFDERTSTKQIVSLKDVEAVIEQVGTVESLQEELKGNEQFSQNQNESMHQLYRNTSNKVIAGVCSGIAHYFGVKEVLWIRILFILLVFAGVSPFVYLLIWVFAPSKNLVGVPLGNQTFSSVFKRIKEEVHRFIKSLSKMSSKGIQY